MVFRYEDLNEVLFDKVVAFSYSIGSGLGGPGAIIMLTRDEEQKHMAFVTPQRVAMFEYIAVDDRFREVNRNELD